MKIFLVTLFLMIAALAKGQEFSASDCKNINKPTFKKEKIKICDKILNVEVADTDWTRSFGLMCRTNLEENSGMLFVFTEERELSFWMKNTFLPLTIAYFDKTKTLIDTYDMKPVDETKIYRSKKKSLYALETNKGWFTKNKIHDGCKFDFVNDAPKNVTKGQ
jgi:uncharacterized protein